MKNSVSRDDRGFTLVELIVAIAILAIIVIPLLNTFVVGAKTTSKAAAYGNATAAARNLAETVQAADAAKLLSDKPGDAISGAAGKDGKFTIQNYSYGGQSYTATVKMTGAQETFPVSSKIDLSLDMTGADDTLAANLQNAYPSMTSYTLNGTRRITADVTKSGDAHSYALVVTFRYNGTLTYTYPATDKDGKPVTASATTAFSQDVKSASYTLKSGADKAPYYTVCLYYKGFYSNAKKPGSPRDNILLNVPETDAVRFFLVDTAQPAATESNINGYSARADYVWQALENRVVKQRLVFWNLPQNFQYYAAGTSSSTVVYLQTFEPYLVDEETSPRKWAVEITLSQSGKTVATLKTTKLA